MGHREVRYSQRGTSHHPAGAKNSWKPHGPTSPPQKYARVESTQRQTHRLTTTGWVPKPLRTIANEDHKPCLGHDPSCLAHARFEGTLALRLVTSTATSRARYVREPTLPSAPAQFPDGESGSDRRYWAVSTREGRCRDTAWPEFLRPSRPSFPGPDHVHPLCEHPLAITSPRSQLSVRVVRASFATVGDRPFPGALVHGDRPAHG